MNSSLVCKKLTKKYEKGAIALDKFSISVPSNGIFSLIGRNGAGKTTLIRILATELMPSSGSASINGIDVVKDADYIRQQIAVLPQEARAIPWLTARQSIYSYLLYRGFGRTEALSRVKDSLKRLGIEKYENTLNRLLSGGLKRKVLIAMILGTGAKVLFIDEPTTGLDPISRADLWNVLKELKNDYFMVLTTHYLEEAEKLADVIGILEAGKLMGKGSMKELRDKIKYQYSIRILQKGVHLKTKLGHIIHGADGSAQILTTEHDVNRLTSKLIKDKLKFSINPVSLDDIFYYMVKKPIEEESYNDEEEWS